MAYCKVCIGGWGTEMELKFVDLAGGSGPVVGSCGHNNELLGSVKCP